MNDNEHEKNPGYQAILLDDIHVCSMMFGTEQYRTAVMRLRHDVLNLKDGPQLRDEVEAFIRGPWRKKINDLLARWKHDNPDLREELQIVQDEEAKIEDELMTDLCDYIKQLLEDNGCIQQYYSGGEGYELMH